MSNDLASKRASTWDALDSRADSRSFIHPTRVWELAQLARKYNHLLFQVSTPEPGPWPVTATTPEGEKFADIQDENQLRAAIQKILERERTKEIVLYLFSRVS
jgi:hypothetical protein